MRRFIGLLVQTFNVTTLRSDHSGDSIAFTLVDAVRNQDGSQKLDIAFSVACSAKKRSDCHC
jgi:hypothetical protein